MSKTKKVISVVLALALVMAMATVAMVSASAATTVYFENTNGWSAVHAYIWQGDVNNGWPGVAMTDCGNGFWSIDAEPGDSIIFTDGVGGVGAQTADNVVPADGNNCAYLDGGYATNGFGETFDSVSWKQYADNNEQTTTEAAPVETTTEAAPVETTTEAAPVETTAVAEPTTVVTEPTEATTAVATDDEEPTTAVATDDEEPTTAVVEPTTVVTEPVESSTAVVEPTTVVVEPTTAVAEPTTVVVEPTTVVEEPTAAVKNVIVVGGVEYTAQVGDIITYTANLTTPKNIENVQANVTFDSAKLKLVDTTAADRFPAMFGVVSNAQDGILYFNASDISTGYDFTANQVLVTLQFEVLDNTYSEIKTTIEEMVELMGGDYATGNEIVADGVVLTETLDVPVVIETTTEAETTDAETTTVVVAPTDATSATKDEEKPADTVPTGVAATIYVVLAVLAMAAAAVVVLRKKVNG